MEKQKGRKIENANNPSKINGFSDFAQFSLLCIVYTLLIVQRDILYSFGGLANN